MGSRSRANLAGRILSLSAIQTSGSGGCTTALCITSHIEGKLDPQWSTCITNFCTHRYKCDSVHTTVTCTCEHTETTEFRRGIASLDGDRASYSRRGFVV